jgi:hypothetical protein
VDSHKRRDVACYDIPGAFLHADRDEDMTMVLKGCLAELMVQVAPNHYCKYVTVNKRNTPILYVKLAPPKRIAVLQEARGGPQSKVIGSC